MPSCSMFGCKNHSMKTRGTNIKYYRFPKDDTLAQKWAKACHRQDQCNVKNAYVCSLHFDKTSFQRILKHELLNYCPKNTRNIKEDAVPLAATELNSVSIRTVKEMSESTEQVVPLAPVPEISSTDELQKAPDKEDVIVLDDDDQSADIIDLVGQVAVGDRKCINYECKSGVDLCTPPIFCMTFYRVRNDSNKNQKVCRNCYDIAVHHYDRVYGVFSNGENVMEIDFPVRDETFAIDDSDSEDDNAGGKEEVMLDPDTIKMLEQNFDDVYAQAIKRVNYEEKVDEAINFLHKKNDANMDSYLEVKTMVESIRKEVDSMLMGLFGKLRVQNKSLPELIIEDDDGTEPRVFSYPRVKGSQQTTSGQSKNLPISENEVSSTTKIDKKLLQTNIKTEPLVDMKPPVNLPPKGTVYKPPLIIGNYYYAKRNATLCSWVKVKLETILGPASIINQTDPNTLLFKVSRENNQKIASNRVVNGRELAYSKPPNVRLEVGARVIALFKEYGDLKISKRDAYYPGVVGEPPTQYNQYRYLIFFDDGYAHYVHFNNVYLIIECSKDVWEDVSEDSRSFIKKYITEYPNRMMVMLAKNQTIRTEFRGKWYVTTVMNVDCSLAQIFFDSQSRVEWIYRGSRRLNTMYKEEQAATNRLQHRQRTPRAVTTSIHNKAPYVQYTTDDPDVIYIPTENETDIKSENKSVLQQRSVAKKSTRSTLPSSEVTTKPFLPVDKNDGPPGKIVYYTPRKQNPNAKIYKPHNCTEACQKEMHTPLQRLKGYGALAKPLLCGFYRLHYKVKGKKPHVVYKTPCGKTVRNMDELHFYLRATRSQLGVDLFNFDYLVRCLAEFILEPNNPIIKDLSGGQEEIQIPVVNYADSEPNNFVNYSTKRMPMEGVHLNLDPNFLIGCNCEDDCSDRNKCTCWQLTFEGAKYLNKDLDEIGYHYRRLQDSIFTGIYECNSRCKCAKTCLNRVVQNPMQHKLQVFKTASRGWGIRCINDIPQGSFLCIYAGALLTEEVANDGGKADGDEYLAELDYIEVVEGFKDDYEEEAYHSDEDTTQSSGKEEEDDEEDEPGLIGIGNIRFKRKGMFEDYDFVPSTSVSQEDASNIRTRLRKRTTAEMEDKRESQMKKNQNKKVDEDDVLTISDDDDALEPSSFNPAEDDLDRKVKKYKSVRTLFGETENVYIMDAKNTGNIGRYLNHSCSPNVFVQNVFVDTHDLRFPWVSFFAKTYIRAGTELTWNYNYDIGSVQGKTLICRCGSSECKGRLL